MTYSAKILADSVGPHGIRLTTFEVTFPRFILAEVNTHRMLSRNSASSRAIPTEKQIEMVKRSPFIPTFNARVKGMGVGEELSEDQQEEAQWVWKQAANNAVLAASALLHVDKSRANRLLEPFTWHTAIISATEWWNFFGLRVHEDAQPEIFRISKDMKSLYLSHDPEMIDYGDWHLPLIDAHTRGWLSDDFPEAKYATLAEVSAGRCAKVSYDTHHRLEAPWESQNRWGKLWPKAHWSPGEHPAQCVEDTNYIGNFAGFKQLRKFYPNEDIFEG